jgi:hypothetical protein
MSNRRQRYSRYVSFRGYALSKPSKRPTDRNIRNTFKKIQEHLEQIQGLEETVEAMRADCDHAWTQLFYRDRDGNRKYATGVFDISRICKKCFREETVEKTPALCLWCNNPLTLWHFPGKEREDCPTLMRKAWEKENKAREDYYMQNMRTTAVHYTQFGVFGCTNNACPEHNKPKFYLTWGD